MSLFDCSIIVLLMRFEGLHGENSRIIRFAVTPCKFSFVSMCGSEKNRRNSTFPTVYSASLQETADSNWECGLCSVEKDPGEGISSAKGEGGNCKGRNKGCCT